MILDGGPCPLGIESTVVAVLGDAARFAQAGRARRARRSSWCSVRRLPPPQPIIAALRPASLKLITRPHTPLRLGAVSVAPDEALLAFGGDVPAGARATINLSAERQSRRGCGQAVRGAPRPRPVRGHGHRRDADSRPRARRGHQRPLAARRQSALALSYEGRARDTRGRAGRPSMRWSASWARSTPFATRRRWRLISWNGATAIAARRRWCSSPAKPKRSPRS